MAAIRFIPQEVASAKAGRWQRTLGRALHGRTLGIFGYGHIGSLVATYGQVFGMRVLAWGREGSRAQADGIEVAASREALFRDADVLSLHLALTEETRGMEEALRAGRPGYPAVDVYESEPVADHPLLHMDNVVCTPHLGYVEKDSYESLFGACSGYLEHPFAKLATWSFTTLLFFFVMWNSTIEVEENFLIHERMAFLRTRKTHAPWQTTFREELCQTT